MLKQPIPNETFYRGITEAGRGKQLYLLAKAMMIITAASSQR